MSADLTLDQKVALLTGRDMWSTQAGAGIRSITLVDGPHGVRWQGGTADNLGINESLPATCFPTGAALGSSWDRALVREVGEALGSEARMFNADVLLGPAINIKRSPLNGRNFEYLSEDPVLTGMLATEYVHGVQSTGAGACVKHFAVNNQEHERMRVSAEVDERTLREIYLAAFERVVKEASPTTLMSAYNSVNGVPASENRWLLTQVLRGEWGFDGLIVSDWGAVKDRAAALAAGLDLEMPGPEGEGTEAIVMAVREGRIDESVVDASLERVRRLAERVAPGATAKVDFDAHHVLARRAAAGSIVLLRNERETLPLRTGQKIAVIGDLARSPRFQGGGSSHVNPTSVDVPLDKMRAAFGVQNVAFAADLPEAVDIARVADVAVVFVGVDGSSESEGFDREHLELAQGHAALIESVAEVAKRTVVVLFNGGVVSLEPWHDRVDAIVEGWLLGQAVGGAITDVLRGVVNPSGRLAETIPLALADTPAYLNFPGENLHARYGEGVFVGYRHYESVGRAVRYPFGHGLSYTTFRYAAFRAEPTGPDTARASVTVRNDGPVAGSHVVQVYVAPAPSSVRRPVRELVTFDKVHLESGESIVVEFDLDRRAFAHWDQPGARWVVRSGWYELQLGFSAHEIVERIPLLLEGDTELPSALNLDSTVAEWFAHPVVGPMLLVRMMGNVTPEEAAAEAEASGLNMVQSMPMGQFARFPGVGLPPDALDQLIARSMPTNEGQDREVQPHAPTFSAGASTFVPEITGSRDGH